MLGKRCPFCGIYIKFFQRQSHEQYHAEQVVHVLGLLCAHCATEHSRDHIPCDTFPACRCSCNAARIGEE
jgi:hypothetical protein